MTYVNIPPLGIYRINSEQSRLARSILAWSPTDLANASGVSIGAIQRFEAGEAPLRDVTLQALTYCFESEGLLFVPEHPPLRGENVRGCTPDPAERKDFALIE